MEREEQQPCHFQTVCERLLWVGALALSAFYLLISLYRDIMPRHEVCFRAAQWGFLLLAGAALLYLIVNLVFFPKTRCRIRAFFLRMASYEQIALIGLFFWFVVVCWLRRHFFGADSFRSNDWWIFLTALTGMLLFPLTRFRGAVVGRHVIAVFLRLLLIPHMFFYAWLLWRYLHMNYPTFPSGLNMYMYDASMYLINRNGMGAYAATLLCLSLYMLFTVKSAEKILYGLGALIYAAMMVLANSRSSWYASLLVVVIAAFWGIWNCLDGKKTVVRAAAGLLCALICALVFHWFRGEMFVLLDKTTHFATPAAEAAETASGRRENRPASCVLMPLSSGGNRHSAAAELSRSSVFAAELAEDTVPSAADYARSGGGLSGRVPLYRASVYLMFHDPSIFFFGVTPSDVGITLEDVCGVPAVYSSAHNLFLQMGMSYGVPAMAATIVFVASLIVRAFRIAFVNRKKLFPGAWAAILPVCCLLVIDMMEAQINATTSLMCAVFHLFAGWLVTMDGETRERKPKRLPAAGSEARND